ncbi:Regulator of G-protein signaling 20 [Macaca fascicularis]|uniref:Regulator of G-protein signaling 20 n=1 Tax=Macaca fascicularis TaxID=9541 RepID=G7PBU5_MACFA|nr:Regulator of G-protein signaling 20 [Macaca fascicularis]
MPQLSQDNQECLQKHFFRPSIWTQFLPLFRAQRYNADIHQITENEGDPRAIPDIKPFPPAQLPYSPAAPKLLGLLYSPLSSLTRFFFHLLRRPPPEAPRRRPNFSPLLPALPAARLSRGHEELPGRLSLLLGAALALPGRPSGGRPLRPARPVGKPREEDATAGQSSPMPPMGSERMEMRKRQMPLAQDAPGAAPGQPGAGSRGSNACCFCWCCCCSCSCLTVRNQEDQRPTIASHELRADLPTWEESPAPTLEEVNAWAQSFDKLMVTPAGRNAFREFLRTEFSEENMLFWMACEELKKEANKNIIEEKARIIYEDYISILSPKEVSLDSRVREVINRNMVEPSQHIFDDAQLQIYTLMHRDSYPRFMNSAVYKDLLQSLSEKSIEA